MVFMLYTHALLKLRFVFVCIMCFISVEYQWLCDLCRYHMLNKHENSQMWPALKIFYKMFEEAKKHLKCWKTMPAMAFSLDSIIGIQQYQESLEVENCIISLVLFLQCRTHQDLALVMPGSFMLSMAAPVGMVSLSTCVREKEGAGSPEEKSSNFCPLSEAAFKLTIFIAQAALHQNRVILWNR